MRRRLLQAFVLVCTGTLVLGACVRNGSTAQTASSGPDFVFDRKPAGDIIFLSTQMNPVEEAAKMRTSILGDFPGKVDFRPNDNNYLFSQIDVLLGDNPDASVLVGALQGDLVQLWKEGKLRPVDDLFTSLSGRTFQESLLDLCRFDREARWFVPWMQASYLMVAHRSALKYLPAGARLESLTYDNLFAWAKTIAERTGKPGVGFPAGEKGLMHRFFQGYLYPSFTGSTLVKFRSDAAVVMWDWFRNFWQYVNPSSFSYSTMSEPLLAGDVLIAWDHTARLVKALEQKPDDFVVFPAPSGPAGRGFMPVLSGLAIPSGARSVDDLSILVDYLTRQAVQGRTLGETGFFPVLDSMDAWHLPPHLVAMQTAIALQSSGADSIPVMMPTGLGTRGAEFNALYMLTFSRIVLERVDARVTLDDNAVQLQGILDSQAASCWLPDVADSGTCVIE